MPSCCDSMKPHEYDAIERATSELLAEFCLRMLFSAKKKFTRGKSWKLLLGVLQGEVASPSSNLAVVALEEAWEGATGTALGQ